MFGLTATIMPDTAPAIRIHHRSRGQPWLRRPVAMSQTPTARKTTVITHRSVAPTAASALTVSVTWLKDRGCSRAAIVHPPISKTGEATDDTTPHQRHPPHRSNGRRGPVGGLEQPRLQAFDSSGPAGMRGTGQGRDGCFARGGAGNSSQVADTGRGGPRRLSARGRPQTEPGGFVLGRAGQRAEPRCRDLAKGMTSNERLDHSPGYRARRRAADQVCRLRDRGRSGHPADQPLAGEPARIPAGVAAGIGADRTPGRGRPARLRPLGRTPRGAFPRAPWGSSSAHFITQLDLGPPHLVGPDVGASAALFLAAQHPGAVRSLVIGGGGVAYPLEVTGTLADIIAAPGNRGVPRPGHPRLDRIDRRARWRPVTREPDVWEDYVSAYENGRFAESTRFRAQLPRAASRAARPAAGNRRAGARLRGRRRPTRAGVQR